MALAKTIASVYDRATDLKSFDQTKSGVQGLVDAGIKQVPRIFINQSKNIRKTSNSLELPVVDLGSTDRALTIENTRVASEKMGFFQVVNHGIPLSVMNEALQGVRRFHEQDVEIKKRFYTRDASRPVTFFSFMAPSPPPPEELPEVCRDIQIEYSNQVLKLGGLLFRLISEALGLKPSYLGDLDCDKGLAFFGHCYPACPQPDLTMGTTKHTDTGFLTVLLQDDIGGLQILHQNQWVDVPPTPGALVINIGDLLQASFLVGVIRKRYAVDISDISVMGPHVKYWSEYR
ncbi:putative deacetoxyvindoline 4-hydroxylase [Helianthus annuus]|nr:putative deacetoxyvindoline 4-hydroxylase [Helianthus annuus]